MPLISAMLEMLVRAASRSRRQTGPGRIRRGAPDARLDFHLADDREDDNGLKVRLKGAGNIKQMVDKELDKAIVHQEVFVGK